MLVVRSAVRSAILAASFATVALGQLNLGGLLSLNLSPDILSTPGTLVNVNAIATVLSDSSTCAVGLAINLPPLLSVCACVSALGIRLGTQRDCAACTTPNSVQICAGGFCGCACTNAFFAGQDGTCILRSTCAPPNNLLDLVDGTSTCVCAAGYQANLQGGCSLVASARARKVKKSLPPPGLCPGKETACSFPSGGYECLDVTSSLDSCGGCLGQGGVNCLAIPGALGVSCLDSVCEIHSCFPGFTFNEGQCVRD